MQDLAATAAFSMSCPQTLTEPEEGAIKPAIMRMVVDFPAPFATKTPRPSPGDTVNVRSSTASLSPYNLDKFFVVIMGALDGDEPHRFQILSLKHRSIRYGRPFCR